MSGAQVDPSADLPRMGGDILSQNPDLPLLRAEEVRQNREQCGLSRSVLAKNAPKGSLGNAEIHIMQRCLFPFPEPSGNKGFPQTFHFDGKFQGYPFLQPEDKSWGAEA